MSIEAPRLFPTLRCQDADRMIAWLVEHAGFTEHAIYRDDAGRVAHAELAFGSAMMMLGEHRDDAYGALVGSPDGRRTDALYVAVDDPDAMHASFAASGAEIVQQLRDTDYGSREFAVRDPEGNLWSFGSYWPKLNEAS